MANSQHIFKGAGAPTFTPAGAGHHYENTTTGESYISTDTEWILVTSAEIFDAGRATVVSVAESAGNIILKTTGTGEVRLQSDNTTTDSLIASTGVLTLQADNGVSFKGNDSATDGVINTAGALSITATNGITLGNLKWPTADGSANQVLSTNGSKVLGFVDFPAQLSAAAIKTEYESNPDTNAYTDAEKAKLASLSAGAGGVSLSKSNFETKMKSRFGNKADYYADPELGYYSQIGIANTTDQPGTSLPVAQCYQYPYNFSASGTGAGVYTQKPASWMNLTSYLTTGTTATGSVTMYLDPYAGVAANLYSVIEEQFNFAVDYTSSSTNRYTLTCTGLNNTTVSYSDTLNSGKLLVSYKDSTGATQTASASAAFQNQYQYPVVIRYTWNGSAYNLLITIDSVTIVNTTNNYMNAVSSSAINLSTTFSITKSVGVTARQVILGKMSSLLVLL